MTTIGEKTKISVALLIPLVGFISWLTALHSLANATAEDVNSQQMQIQKMSDENQLIYRETLTRLGRIEGKLDQLTTRANENGRHKRN